jgi:acetyltransferase-like isoleucine patch superfamily enzyme
MWHTRIQTTILEEDFITLTKYHNDSNSRECNQKRASLLGFEDSVKIAPGANVRLGANGALGSNVFIGLCSYVNGDVAIEDDVLIGPFCSLTSNSHLFNVEELNFRGNNLNRPIRVGRGTWLSTGVAVNPGVSIGKCNLILPSSVVTKSTEDFLIVGGNPARICGRIDQQTGQLVWLSAEKRKQQVMNGESSKSEYSDDFMGYQNWVIQANEVNEIDEVEKENSATNSRFEIETLRLKVQSLESKLEETNRTVDKLSNMLASLMKDSS